MLSLTLSATCLAGNGGSSYSRYGIGDLRFSSSDISTGMGTTGIGVFSTNNINQLNPAALSSLTRTRFSIGFDYDGFNSSNGTSSVYLSGTKFDNVMVAIPLYTPSGIVMDFGFTPYSTVNYDILSSSTFDGALYQVNYSGEGGLSEGQLGVSWLPSPLLSVGAKLSYYFGTERHTISQTFNQSDYSDANQIRSMIMHGAGGTLGLIYTGLGKALNLDSTRLFTLGLVATFGSNLTLREEQYYAFTAASQNITTRDTVTSDDRTMKLPFKIGIGTSFRTPEFLVAGDFTFQQWNTFNDFGAFAGDLRNSCRVGVGGELFPHREASASFFQHLAYRAGFFYDASYYNINGQPINEIGITAGTGIPIFADTRLNVGAQYSFRGTNDNGLVKDKILRLTFSLSGSERWFLPSEDE